MFSWNTDCTSWNTARKATGLFSNIPERGLYVSDDTSIVLQVFLTCKGHCHFGQYRDLKPENILDSKDQILLADFGLAMTDSGSFSFQGPSFTSRRLPFLLVQFPRGHCQGVTLLFGRQQLSSSACACTSLMFESHCSCVSCIHAERYVFGRGHFPQRNLAGIFSGILD